MPRVKKAVDVPIYTQDEIRLHTLNAYEKPFLYWTGVKLHIAEGERYVVFLNKYFVRDYYIRLAGGIMGLYPCDSDMEIALPLENLARQPQSVPKGALIAHAIKIT